MRQAHLAEIFGIFIVTVCSVVYCFGPFIEIMHRERDITIIVVVVEVGKDIEIG